MGCLVLKMNTEILPLLLFMLLKLYNYNCNIFFIIILKEFGFMDNKQSNNKRNICGKQIHLIRTGQYDKKHPKITQEMLAARLQVLGLDIDRTAISKIETGDRVLRDFEIILFAEALKVPIEIICDISAVDDIL